MRSRKYTYFINLDERDEFSADVRDELGATIWQINMEDANELVTDGFVRDPRDMEAIRKHLVYIGLMHKCDELSKGN